jgi:hypothetical protein
MFGDHDVEAVPLRDGVVALVVGDVGVERDVRGGGGGGDDQGEQAI